MREARSLIPEAITTRLCFDLGPLNNLHSNRGIGTCTRRLVAELDPTKAAEHGFELTFVREAPRWSRAESGDAADSAGRKKRIELYLADRWNRVEGMTLLPGAIRRTGAEVFFTPDPQVVVLSRHFRTVAMVYDLIPLLFKREYLPRLAPLNRLGYWYDLHRTRKAHHLVAISESTKRDVVRHLGVEPERVTVAQLGVDRERFRPLDRDRARARIEERYGVSRPYFFYIGGLDPRKNIQMLVDSFLAVADRLEADLVIAGTLQTFGEGLQEHFARHPHYRRVRWLGFVAEEDLPFFYAGSLALVFPSRYEGFGLPVAEAMRCGAPVVTTTAGSLVEVGGDVALYVDPDDQDGLSKLMCRVAADSELRRDLGERGIERAERFTWDRTLTCVLEACARAAEDPPRRG